MTPFTPSKSPLARGFVDQLKRTPIRTPRFLWHISYDCDYIDMSIAAQGLLCPPNYAVFAHANVTDFEFLYPCFLDAWDINHREKNIRAARFNAYSFWRIDTQLIDNEWYRDPNMAMDAKAYGTYAHYYLCSNKSVPSDALKLFKFDLQRYIDRKPFISGYAGVSSIRACKSDFDCLVPDRFVNEYIDWKRRKNDSRQG